MKTTLKSYYFDTRNPEEAAEYKTLRAQLAKTNGRCFETWGGKGSHYNAAWAEGVPVTLETDHLFGDQWNTAPADIAGNLRVHNWAQDCPISVAFRPSAGMISWTTEIDMETNYPKPGQVFDKGGQRREVVSIEFSDYHPTVIRWKRPGRIWSIYATDINSWNRWARHANEVPNV